MLPVVCQAAWAVWIIKIKTAQTVLLFCFYKDAPSMVRLFLYTLHEHYITNICTEYTVFE